MVKRALVTGGAGFIGSHLCDFLLKKGYEVVCIDNLSTGDVHNIKHLIKKDRFQFLHYNIVNNILWRERFNEIWHLASPASPADYMRMPLQTMLVNSVGTKNMLDLARANKARCLIASTSEVYGDPLAHPQKETYSGNVQPFSLRSCYDEAKRFAEALACVYANNGVNVKVARIFNTYGPRMRKDDGRVVPNLILQALKNKPLTIYGDGTQTRSFCYISDLIEGLFRLMQSDYKQPVNLGSDEEITVLELAEKIKTLTHSKSRLDFKPLPEGDPARRKPDLTIAKKILKWQPKISLEEGLKKTIEWFKLCP